MSPTDATATGTTPTTPTGTAGSPLKNSLGEAGDHLKQAARDAGETVRGAAGAAGEELKRGKTRVESDLADGALAGMDAAEYAGAAAREQADELMDKGREMIDSAAVLIRERPIAAFGAAFAAGWIISKLGRDR